MGRRRGRPPALALLVLLVVLGGCWDSRSLDQRAFVIMMGIDRPEEHIFEVTVEVPLGATGGGGEAGLLGTDRQWEGVSARAISVERALETISANLARELDLRLLSTVVIGEEMARHGLHDLDWLSRTLDVPSVANVAVTRGKAAKVALGESHLFAVPGLFPHFTLGGTFTRSPAVVPTPVWLIMLRLFHSPFEDAYAAGLTVDEQGINTDGLAVFRDNRLAGWLDKEETELFGMVKAGRYQGVLSRRLPETQAGWVSFSVQGGRTRLGVRLEDDEPVLTIDQNLRGTLRELVGRRITDLAQELRVEQDLAESQRQALAELVARLQEIGSDALGFGEIMRRRHPRHPAVADGKTWQEAYARARVEVAVQVVITTPGFAK